LGPLYPDVQKAFGEPHRKVLASDHSPRVRDDLSLIVQNHCISALQDRRGIERGQLRGKRPQPRLNPL
jgi:hypothetical protein